MKTVTIFLACLVSVECLSYGYYKFFKNFGGGFYDYGGGIHNAWNGLSPEPDSSDALCTDRGVYFNGTDTCVTIHSDLSSSAPILSLPIEFNIWVLINKEHSSFLRRKSPSGNHKFEILVDSNFKIRNDLSVIADSGNTTKITQLRTPKNFVSLQTWYFIRIVFTQAHSFEGILEVNDVLQATYSHGSKIVLENELATTRLNRGGKRFEGFVYLLNIFQQGSFDYTYYFTSICTTNLSSCNACPYGKCLSESSDSLQNNNGDLCSIFGCPSSCDADGNCLECPLTSWPVCDFSSSVPDLCDTSCIGCTIDSNSNCFECSNTSLSIVSVPGPCECFSEDLYDCGLCAPDCESCSDTDLCDTCIDPLAIPKLDSSGGCECAQRTYFDTSCKCNVYTVCHQDCSECSQANICDSCIDSLAVPKLDSSEGCECPQGTYFDTSCKCNFYTVCHQDCLECSESNFCISCIIEDAVPNTIEPGCSCPSNSSVVEGACECEKGYFKAQGRCEECETGCLECNERGCSECALEYAIISEDGVCECPENSVANIQDSRCECKQSFYRRETEECLECKKECKSCSDGDSCLSCKDPNAYFREGKCECPENSYFKHTDCVCEDGFYASSDPFECIKTVEVVQEIFKGFSSIETILVVFISLAIGLTSLIVKNPMNIWGLLNTIQTLSYIPLINIDLPSQIRYITTSFDLRNYIPNTIVLFLSRSKPPLDIGKPHWEEFTDTSSFYRNTGEFITSLCLSVAILIFGKIVVVIFPRNSKCLKDKLCVFRYNAFIRLFTEFYLLLVFGSVISFSKSVEFESNDIESYIGCGVLGLCLVAPFVIGSFLYRIRKDLKSTEAKKKFGTLFEEFKIGDQFECTMYYPFLLLKRFLFMTSLFYFYSYPFLQVNSAFSLCLLEIFALKFCIRFKEKWRQRLEVFIQANLALFFSLMTLLASDIGESIKDVISFVMLVVVCAILSINALYYVFGLFCLRNKHKTKPKTQVAKVTPLAIVCEEKVFEFRRNQLLNINEENNIKDDLTNIIK